MIHSLKKGILSIKGEKIAPITFGTEVILENGKTLQNSINDGDFNSQGSAISSSNDFLSVDGGTIIFNIDGLNIKYTSGIVVIKGLPYTVSEGSLTFTASEWNIYNPNYSACFVYNVTDKSFHIRQGFKAQPTLEDGDYIVFVSYYYNNKLYIKTINYPVENFINSITNYDKSVKRLTVIGDSLSIGKRWLTYVLSNNKIKVDSVNLQALAGATITDQGVGYASSVKAGDVVIIFMGTNDCLREKTIGSIDDSPETSSVYGKLKAVISTIYNVDKTIKILIVGSSPLFGYKANDSMPEKYMNDVRPYNEAIKNVCNLYCIPFLNLLECIGINELNTSEMQVDGCHYSNTGYKRLANLIFEKLYTIL